MEREKGHISDKQKYHILDREKDNIIRQTKGPHNRQEMTHYMQKMTTL